ncbi:hypothetical protein C8K30_108262 [Promicromonospora sp. AC04]|uniref:hypothetical protein n=1 Tax=Promicromonospora sp. AC04 TaxID=2135723 RepID=UPI000D3F805A|nr:hypothetical protein [Promicromonospora sp. AC04]PUB25005.1 hypothetical protein C8K30_108262 [Promicromonospora sp. AC04]
MQELVGRLTALDPEASETLKVVAYFDVLVAGGAGLQALLRGAAVLSGTVAGATDGRRTYRMGPDGDRRTETVQVQPHWPSRSKDDRSVWLEREGSPHANDDMVIERLALAADLVGSRRPGEPGSSLETAIDATRDADERLVALSRLRLDPAREVRIAALPPSHDVDGALSTVVATPYGLVRAVVLGQGATVPGPAGVGVPRRADQLPESFRTAVLALRLLPKPSPGSGAKRSPGSGVGCSPGSGAGRSPGSAGSDARSHTGRSSGSEAVIDAADLGVVLAAVSALEPVAAQQPDVVALARLDARTRAVLDELAGSESVRAAATSLGMHHSTLQARHDTLTTELGYDPRSLHGRARFQLARLLLRLVENH